MQMIAFCLFMLSTSGFFGWIVRRAMLNGEMPVPFAGRIHQVSREQMPLAFWFCVGVLCLLSLFSLFVVVLIVF